MPTPLREQSLPENMLTDYEWSYSDMHKVQMTVVTTSHS